MYKRGCAVAVFLSIVSVGGYTVTKSGVPAGNAPRNAVRENFFQVSPEPSVCDAASTPPDNVPPKLPPGEPGGTHEDADKAINNPTDYAWDLFAFLNRQALKGTPGVPDPTVAPWSGVGDVDVVWESWALASGDASSEVFPNDGSLPKPWGSWQRESTPNTGFVKVLLGPSATFTGDRRHSRIGALALSSNDRIDIPPGLSLKGDQEVRVNKADYETIAPSYGSQPQGLYRKSLVQAAVLTTTGKHCFVTFPPGAKEIKAAWIWFQECEVGGPYSDPKLCAYRRKTFHWRTIKQTTPSATISHYWGLAALHIITKDIPNWFWTDFIQRDCEKDPVRCKPQWSLTPKDDPQHYIPKGITPKGETQWDYYHLRGTQTSFTQPPFFDPRIEGTKPNAAKTSCMTCHAYASVPTDSGQPTNLAVGQLQREIFGTSGTPQESYFHQAYGSSSPGDINAPRTFSQSDFVWSIAARVH